MLKGEGMKTAETAVSTNNAPILKMNVSAGFQIKRIEHVYVKHYSD